MLLSQLVLTLPVLLAHALHGGPEPPAEAPLLIHEWGTFTSLQDEEGRSLGWINTDDEPVPDFVHRIACPILGPGDEVNLRFVKSVPRGHPDVTMRLETPVVYFHPGPAHPDGTELDLTVEFRGGWLTEFFPQAEAEAPDFFRPRRTYPPLDGETVSRLTWPGLVLGGEPELPETDAGVWLAPRAVDSAPVTAASGEAEQYLFYRGVGHLEAPLRVSRSPGGDELWIRSNLDLAIEEFDELQIAHLWLVDVRADGHTAWRRLDPLCIGMDHETVQGFVPALFDERDHSLEAGEALRADLLAGLVEDGLFQDEAEGLLNTWEHAYFQTSGLRLFFLVPQAWTDHYLPLETSIPSRVVRTMVGRIELVSPEQRALLERLAAGPVSDNGWRTELLRWRAENAERAAEAAERGQVLELPDLSDERPFAPEDWRAYLDLGRFRNALVLDALARRPTPELAAFAGEYRLQGYTVKREEK